MKGRREVSDIFLSNLIGFVNMDSRFHWIYLKVDYIKIFVYKVNEKEQFLGRDSTVSYKQTTYMAARW